MSRVAYQRQPCNYLNLANLELASRSQIHIAWQNGADTLSKT